MKRIVTILIALIVGIAIGFAAYMLVFGDLIKKPAAAPPQPPASNTAAVQPLEEDSFLGLATNVLSCIEARDWAALSGYVHPEYGVVFVPYSTINLSANKCFTASDVKSFGSSTDVYVWGVYDGTGEPISLTVADYFTKFVYDRDYLAAPIMSIDHILQTGNSLENISEVFPNCRYVEFHFPGTEELDGIDWSTLRLVFEEYGGKMMLTAVIHSQWTI